MGKNQIDFFKKLYFIIGVIQSALFSYLSAVLSTIEKRCFLFGK